jgi:hypothetical protein
VPFNIHGIALLSANLISNIIIDESEKNINQFYKKFYWNRKKTK